MIYEGKGQDSSINIFYKDFTAPIFVVPIGGTDINYGGRVLDTPLQQLKSFQRSGRLSETG